MNSKKFNCWGFKTTSQEVVGKAWENSMNQFVNFAIVFSYRFIRVNAVPEKLKNL